MKANGGRIGFDDGLLVSDKDLDREIKKISNIYTEPETFEEQAGKKIKKKLDSFTPTETEKEKKKENCFSWLKNFKL